MTRLSQAIQLLALFFLVAAISPFCLARPPVMAASTSSSNLTIYFGYGSNLWLHQMALRCPESTYLGIARLPGFRWIINERGYANVVELPSGDALYVQPAASGATHDWNSEVWGMVYSLTASDEARLDRNEGVPTSYTKEMLPVHFWPTSHPAPPNVTVSQGLERLDVASAPKRTSMLVYIDRIRLRPSAPKKEYVHRMNMGIRDALSVGVPSGYVDAVMRKFIPPEKDGKAAEQDALALKQAANFVEEDDPERKVVRVVA